MDTKADKSHRVYIETLRQMTPAQRLVRAMVTGSIASSLQGEPRSTHDIDFVISLKEQAVSKMVEAFPPSEFYLDRDAIIDAIEHNGSFNLEVQFGVLDINYLKGWVQKLGLEALWQRLQKEAEVI